jgi:hypothetical protein
MPLIHPEEKFTAGDTWEIHGSLHYRDGSPFNLNAGAEIEWQLRKPDGTPVLAFTLSGGGGVVTVLDADAGTFAIVVPKTQTGVAAGEYFDQCRATDPSGLRSTQWQGAIKVTASYFP